MSEDALSGEKFVQRISLRRAAKLKQRTATGWRKTLRAEQRSQALAINQQPFTLHTLPGVILQQRAGHHPARTADRPGPEQLGRRVQARPA
jgi:hypothetical protein